ncbi:MAG TPA: class II glutamine amidotransferase [Myxococcaceae bacterium]|nr:class II glutamine amidotransferase [Myxococcaceae bacterium]
MPFAIGIFTSDPNLLRCELARLRDEVSLGAHTDEPMGAGWYAEDAVLLQRYSARVRPERLDQLGGVLESEALLVQAGPLPIGMSLEENTQPFRYRHWLFVHQGAIAGGEKLRVRLMDALPEHLARVVRGSTPSELAFAVYLWALRDAGRTDAEHLEPGEAARVLGTAARRMEQLAQDVGARAPALGLFATNNALLAVARVGEQPMFYRLLEGTATCSICGLDGSAKARPSVRAHLRRRSIVVSTQVADPQAWIPIESGTAVGVGRDLSVHRMAI